jgi:glyoxylase-like metal-dependent hydrolase (beta-lactamase superfamily II)
MSGPPLPPDLVVWERGWLSANNVLFDSPAGSALVDSGYATHTTLTLQLVEGALGRRPLDHLLNTHLHSDHCGGNHALQTRYPGLTTHIPPGQASAVQHWDQAALSYAATGQTCPAFTFQSVLVPGTSVQLGGSDWDIHAAPGHDPDAVLLHQPEHGVLISGDALWENGFGVVFPELDGVSAFDAVAATLDLINALGVRTVIPGHGPVFGGSPAVVAQAVERARSRLDRFVQQPEQHNRYAAKVLLKFKLQEFQRIETQRFQTWAVGTPLLAQLHGHAVEHPFDTWLHNLLQDLVRSGALSIEEGWLIDR